MKIRRDLSPREWRIHDLMEEGLTAKMVAAALGISPRTAAIYMANLKLIEDAQDVPPADTPPMLRLSGSAVRSSHWSTHRSPSDDWRSSL